MQSLHSKRTPFRLSLSLASTVLLAACAGQPGDEMESAAAGAVPSDIASVTSALSNCPTHLSGVTTSGSCYCPPLSSFGSLWGTGVYTSDSHLCTAAVHSGVISASAGGNVSYTILPGRDAYCGSTHHGVSSSNYGSFGGSYSVGGTDLRPIERESVTHTYTAHTVGTSTTTQYGVGTSCMAKPVSIVYVSDNDGELLALGADGARVVLDDNWLPYFDSYTPLSTTRTDCPSVCPN
ncbi:LCCL domain-containing protein [Cystobacter fuscus]|uniref:LCCL domain-containing protein n=1 Tax=Cystobacter fuscus TaxID=43 RepID=UPI0037BE56C6